MNPLLTVEGLLAARRRRQLKPHEARRLAAAQAFRREQADKAYERRAKYRKSRGEPLPLAESASQKRIAERVESEPAKPKRGKESPYVVQRRKLSKKFDLDSRVYHGGKAGKFETRVYNIPFVYGKEGVSFNRDAFRAVFRIESFRESEKYPVVIRAYAQVIFKNDKTSEDSRGIKRKYLKNRETWVSTNLPFAAGGGDNDADSLAIALQVKLASYAVKTVVTIELVASRPSEE